MPKPTPGEESLLAEAEQFAQETANALEPVTSGIPRPPRIEYSETALEPQKMDLGLKPDPDAEADSGGGMPDDFPDDGGGGGGGTHSFVTIAGAVNGVPSTLNVDTDGTGWSPI